MSDAVASMSRRLLFGQLLAGAIATRAAAQDMLIVRGTPQLTLGPFYPVIRPLEEDADLTTIAGRPGRAKGTIIDIAGQVTREDGTPVPNALLDVWQTNSFGSYQHPADTSGAPVDPAFQAAAVLKADEQGRYRFRTVKPSPYATRAPHIHFDVRGKHRRLMTQMFFPGEPLNGKDRLYAGLGSEKLQTKVTARTVTSLAAADPPLFIWDIALAGE